MSAAIAAPRRSVCVECREWFGVETRTGPLPTKCDTCDPEAAARRAERRAGPTTTTKLRARIAELEEELADRVEANEAWAEFWREQAERCAEVRRSRGLPACRCGRDYLTVPLAGPEAACPSSH